MDGPSSRIWSCVVERSSCVSHHSARLNHCVVDGVVALQGVGAGPSCDPAVLVVAHLLEGLWCVPGNTVSPCLEMANEYGSVIEVCGLRAAISEDQFGSPVGTVPVESGLNDERLR